MTINIGPNCSIYARGKNKNLWYARFYDGDKDPKQKAIPLKTNSQIDATGKAYQLYNDWRRGLYDPWRDVDMHTTITQAVSHYKRERDSEIDSWSDGVWVLERVAKLNDLTYVRAITPAAIRKMVYDSKLAEATQESYYNKLHAIIEWLISKGYLDKNPMDEVKKPTKPDRLPKYYSGDQVTELLANAEFYFDMNKEYNHQDQAYPLWYRHAFELVAFTGLRKKETPFLTWGDCRFPDSESPIGSITIRASKKKKSRVVTMLPYTEKILRRIEADTRMSNDPDESVLKNDTGCIPISADYLSRKFTRVQQFAKLHPIGLHGLRHSFAVMLVFRGVHVVAIQKQMGHKRIETTMRYTALSNDDVLRLTYEKFS